MTRPSSPQRIRSKRAFAYSTLAIAATLALGAGEASAFDIDTGNPDLAIRFDNTVRLNYGVRVESRDSKIGNSALSDEGDYSFDKNDAVAKRFDLLSEFDLIYKKRYGLRVSGAAWYDFAYDSGTSKSNPNAPLVNIPSYVGNQYSSTVKRLYRDGAEVLDAFIFGGVDLGAVPVQAKLGRHTIYWGESLLLGGHLHSVAYAQAPLDLQKGFATPGTEVKELFRPLNQLSMQAQVTDTLSLAGQYMLEWEPARYPEGGTYLRPGRLRLQRPGSAVPVGRPRRSPARGAASEPKQHGEFGLTARWSPEWLDGSMGFYYRNFADKLPQVLLTRAGPGVSQYNMIYADNIQLFGASIAKNIGGVSTSAEISYRKNTPLNAQVLGVALGLPGQGDTKGPRGDTLHGLVERDRHDRRRRRCSTPRPGPPSCLVAPRQRRQRREPLQRRRLRALQRQGQVGRLRDPQLRRHRRLVQPDLVPGPAGCRPVGADDLRDRRERQRRDDLRRQPRPRQLQRRSRRRRAAEVPLRPEVHRLSRSLPRQRHRRDLDERTDDVPA